MSTTVHVEHVSEFVLLMRGRRGRGGEMVVFFVLCVSKD
jgi:hypothetical protein